MLHRIKRTNDIHNGKWNGLGGKFKPSETPEECVIREVKEESGLVIKNPILKGILTFPAFDKDEDWHVYVFVAREFTGEIIESDEGHLKWISDFELTDLPLWEGDKIFFKWLDQDRFFSGKFAYENGQLTHHSVVFYG